MSATPSGGARAVVPIGPMSGKDREPILTALQAQVEALHAHDPEIRASHDPEGLRRMRIAVRRLRATLRASCGVSRGSLQGGCPSGESQRCWTLPSTPDSSEGAPYE